MRVVLKALVRIPAFYIFCPLWVSSNTSVVSDPVLEQCLVSTYYKSEKLVQFVSFVVFDISEENGKLYFIGNLYLRIETNQISSSDVIIGFKLSLAA